MTTSRGGRYVFDTAADAERRRLEAQTDLWDPFTFRVLAATGVAAGWHGLEIGAGTGSVAAWLVDRIGPDGLVVAADVETRWLEPLASPNLVVRHHNVVADQLDEHGYHLIHVRLVLEHLAERQVVVDVSPRGSRRTGRRRCRWTANGSSRPRGARTSPDHGRSPRR
jgi:hypothetical protein